MSETTINWAKLVSQNRAKAPGIAWSDEEREALNEGVSADDVRAGILTKEASEEFETDPVKRLARKKKEKLVKIAEDLGIEFDEKAITKDTLINEIVKAQEKKDKTSEPEIEPEKSEKSEEPKYTETPLGLTETPKVSENEGEPRANIKLR